MNGKKTHATRHYPALLTAGKTGPPDRPTDGHHKAAIFGGGAFFLLEPCAFRAAEQSNQQNNNENKPLFCIVRCHCCRGRFRTCPIDRWSSCRPSLQHGRSFTAPLTREALRAERRAAAERAVQGVLKVAFCSFLDQLPPRLPPRPSTNPTFTSFLTQTPIMLTKELLLHLLDAPSLLAQRCKLWREFPEHHHLRFVTVCRLRVVCIPTISYIHCQNKPKNS